MKKRNAKAFLFFLYLLLHRHRERACLRAPPGLKKTQLNSEMNLVFR